jgi:hypothetical protein
VAQRVIYLLEASEVDEEHGNAWLLKALLFD